MGPAVGDWSNSIRIIYFLDVSPVHYCEVNQFYTVVWYALSYVLLLYV